MKRTILLIAVLLISRALSAEELMPPVPEGMDTPPPAAGDEPLPSLKDLDKFLEGQATPTDLEPGPAKPEEAMKAIEKALPTETPLLALPSPKAAEPVAKPTATWAPQTIAPAPTAKSAVAASGVAPSGAKPDTPAQAAPVAGTSSVAPAVAAPKVPASSPASVTPPATVVPAASSTGALTDYFPVASGMKWTYEYLKSASGKKILTVECTEAQTFDNGTTRAVFQVTGETSVPETYSLFNGAVQRTAHAGATLEGDYAFKLPKKGIPSVWTTGTGSFAASFTASFGKAVVYQKTYLDCVVVKEKTASSTMFLYYAKGIGLVAMEVYGAGMKLDQTKSFALISGPTK